MITRHPMYINGQRVESHRGAWFPVYDPSTEEVIAEVPDADAQDVDRAVAAARAAAVSPARSQASRAPSSPIACVNCRAGRKSPRRAFHPTPAGDFGPCFVLNDVPSRGGKRVIRTSPRPNFRLCRAHWCGTMDRPVGRKNIECCFRPTVTLSRKTSAPPT